MSALRLHCPRSPRPSRGFTLPEALIVMLLLALLLAFALPAGQRWLERQRLWHAAETVLADLYLARSEAMHGSRNVLLRLLTTPDGSCYVVYSGPVNSCQCALVGPSICQNGSQALKTAQWPRQTGRPLLTSNVASMLFSSRLGTVALAATFRVTTEGIGEVRHVVGITGRIRSCAVNQTFKRWSACEGAV
jgi:prepilin-type N-terminal cleavage/methylation domain-containing protein